MLLIAAVIKLSDGGPVFFVQRRVGLRGQTFRMLKFRSMVIHAERLRPKLQLCNESNGPVFKMRLDPRVTAVGRFIRRYSLDELPQLLNVLRGNMSLVGPRPLILDEDQFIQAWGRTRLDLKPGVTGLWQVLGRSDIPFEEMVKLDYLYVTSWSFFTDMKLMLRTIPLVLGSRHAY